MVGGVNPRISIAGLSIGSMYSESLLIQTPLSNELAAGTPLGNSEGLLCSINMQTAISQEAMQSSFS